MPSQENAKLVLDGLRRAGINMVASLPDAFLVNVIEDLQLADDLIHVPLTREEEGIGVCTGAYLGGMRCALLIQNAGLLNSCNAIATTAMQIEIPMLLVVLYAGARGDVSFPTLGRFTEPVLSALNIPFCVPATAGQIADAICDSVVQAYNSRMPVAVLLRKPVL